MTSQPVASRVDEVVSRMTLAELASLTGGRDVWHLPPVERLGIGALKMSDGPSGVRGAEMGTRRSLSFPCGTAAGATWDLDLIGRYGVALGDEARSKGVHLLLGPTVCIPRTPLGGRTFESFAEDPFLAARLTVAYVRGVQSRGVGCCVKHFACNDQEHERMTISAEVDDRTLREVHLVPFEAAVKEAGVWAIMAAYNKLNGTYCSEHEVLLGRILKDQWGFDGVVVSDWLGTHSTVGSTLAGLDVEMPGPPSFLGSKLAVAVAAGEVDESVLTEHARRIVRLMERCGVLDGEQSTTEREDDDPQRRAVARELAIGGTVLLRNDGMLPIDPQAVSRVALIGANALQLQTGGGGSSQVTPLAKPSLLAELRACLPGVEITVEEGCRIDRGLPRIDMALLDGGLSLELHDRSDPNAPPAGHRQLHRADYIVIGEPLPGLPIRSCDVRATATFTPDVSGIWRLGIGSVGGSRLYLGSRLVCDNADTQPGEGFFGLGRQVVSADVDLVAGRSYDLLVELYATDKPITGFEVFAERPQRGDAFERAVEAAHAADVAIVVVGSNSQWETEGADRTDLRLAGRQDELVRAVAAVNPRTAVVLNQGAPIEMPWIDEIAAALTVWYPGEEGAGALAQVLVGAADPGGRLPITFPRQLDDVPTATPDRYPGIDGKVEYSEGLLIGHRHYDAHGIDPLFPFGHGLSYTTFELGTPEVEVGPSTVTARVPVTNTGHRRGTEVVQLYVEPEERSEGRPVRHLAGFAKVALDPGETVTADIVLDDRAFSVWDDATGAWRTPSGNFALRVGTSSRNLPHTAKVALRRS